MSDSKAPSTPHGWDQRKFKLSADIESRTLSDNTRLLKQTRFATYMSLESDQFAVLDGFKGDKNLREVLRSFLEEEFRPNLQEFYALVVEAVDKGFLEDADGRHLSELPQAKPSRWLLGWSPFAAVLAGVLLTALGAVPLVSAVTLPAFMPHHWILVFIFTGIVISVAMLSSGCVLKGAGRTVYGLRMRFKCALPCIEVDTRDAFMGGPFAEVAVALQALSIPFFMAVIAFLIKLPSLQMASFMALLVLSSPFGQTPALHMIYALFRKRHQHAPLHAFRFLGRRLFTHGFARRSEMGDETYYLLYAFYAISWLGLLLRSVAALLDSQGQVLYFHLLNGPGFLNKAIAGIVLAELAAMAVVPIGYQLFLLCQNIWRSISPTICPAEKSVTSRPIVDGKPSPEDTAAFLKNNALFSQLNDTDLAELANRVSFIRVEKESNIIREHDRGHSLFAIYSGTVEVLKEDDTGTPQRVAKLGAGRIFGEIALLENIPRTATVKSVSETSMFVLSRDAFEELVLSGLGAQTIKATVQVCTFLKTTSMFSGWPDEALLAASREFSFQNVAAGEVVISAGERNETLYLVFEGRFEVRKNGDKTAILKRGDFFGEISLLENVPTTADVVALGSSRCLKLDKARFVDLMSQDFLSGALIENAAERRWKGGHQ